MILRQEGSFARRKDCPYFTSKSLDLSLKHSFYLVPIYQWMDNINMLKNGSLDMAHMYSDINLTGFNFAEQPVIHTQYGVMVNPRIFEYEANPFKPFPFMLWVLLIISTMLATLMLTLHSMINNHHSSQKLNKQQIYYMKNHPVKYTFTTWYNACFHRDNPAFHISAASFIFIFIWRMSGWLTTLFYSTFIIQLLTPPVTHAKPFSTRRRLGIALSSGAYVGVSDDLIDHDGINPTFDWLKESKHLQSALENNLIKKYANPSDALDFVCKTPGSVVRGQLMNRLRYYAMRHCHMLTFGLDDSRHLESSALISHDRKQLISDIRRASDRLHEFGFFMDLNRKYGDIAAVQKSCPFVVNNKTPRPFKLYSYFRLIKECSLVMIVAAMIFVLEICYFTCIRFCHNFVSSTIVFVNPVNI